MKLAASHRCFGGSLGYYSHAAESTACEMRFAVFVPPQAATQSVPVLWWLSGLTCTEENFTIKAGAFRKAAAAGLMIVAPDTSPRGPGVPNDEAYDLGQGAGFYLDAIQAPWDEHFRMYSYITGELNELVCREFPVDESAQGISGHSMGGHGALTIALKHPQRYRSVSAFAPIVAPTKCPWGRKAFNAYLGDNESAWRRYDACELMRAAPDRASFPAILIDQGSADIYLEEQLMPQQFAAACDAADQELELRMQEGYDHSYFFVSSFIDDHIEHHSEQLRA
jgi:S-formylglutathione hydrolase